MSRPGQPEVSIVIPARNEAARLPDSLRELFAWLDDWPRTAEVLVVVEPGADDTAAAVRRAFPAEPRLRVLENKEQRGKGYAVRTGMLAARGEATRFFSDADFSVPPRFIATFVEYFEHHPQTQILIGSRKNPASHIARRQPPVRRMAGTAFNLLLRLMGLTAFADTQCGFKAFRAPAAEALFGQVKIDGFAFDVEILHLAARRGLRVEELPVEWTNSAASTVSLPGHGWHTLRDVLRIRRLHADH